MVKASQHPHDGKSIKTFFIYAAIVSILIIVSLTWKAIQVYQQNKYTGEHFVLALAQKDIVKEIIVLNPSDQSLAVIKITDNGLSLKELSSKASIATDAYLNIYDSSPNIIKDEISKTLTSLIFRYPTLETNTTIFDMGRLSMYAKNLAPNSRTTRELSSEQITEDKQIEKQLAAFFSDNVIATENISIQIINASGVSGMAQRLEKVLLYKGANVVTVSTAQKHESTSAINYFGNETYTLQKIKKLLGFPAKQIEKETIADIVIVLGKDSSNMEIF